jgi:transposase
MLRMIERHAVQQMLTAGVRIGEVARYFEVSRRTIERIRKEPAVEGAVARWKRGVGRPPVPATVRERMQALIAEEAPLEVLRRLREEGHRLGESTFYRLHRAERKGLSKELMVRFEASRTNGQRRSSQLPCGPSDTTADTTQRATRRNGGQRNPLT